MIKELENLVFYGEAPISELSEEESAIELLSNAARTCPKDLWQVIKEAYALNHKGLLILAIAALLSNQIDFYDEIKYYLYKIICKCSPLELLELLEYIKSKIFGGGLGSRSQKLLRWVLESWTLEDLKQYTAQFPTQTYALIRLVHPRYHDERGQLLKVILA